MIKKVFLIIFPGILISSCLTQEQNKVWDSVRTESGLVSGIYNEENGITVFKGVPFAAPPVGELRWKGPQPVEPWEGIKGCTNFSASPIQNKPVPFSMWTQEFISPSEPLSEDCLYLNIWTGAETAGEDRPVFLYIYGGGFSSGSGAVPVYDGEAMARKGIVFITTNYRVGMLGFLAHPELTAESGYGASGNYGLLDQIEALKWIQKNISAFGGDPDNVTIAGQSAGAFSVNYLVASPLAKGLFHRAIAESGGGVLPTSWFAMGDLLSQAEENGVNWAKSIGANSIAELRAKSTDEILAARGFASPVVDGYLLPDPLYTIFSEGKQNDVPVILGWNEDEGIGSRPPQDVDHFINQIREQFGSEADRFFELLPVETKEDAVAVKSKLGSLLTFGIQAYKWMLLQNEMGTSKVFLYHFERDLPFTEKMQDFGAFHTGEVPYAYNNLHMSPRPWEEVDYRLAEMMSSYWANFATSGDPNGDGLVEWGPCTPKNPVTMVFDKEVICKALPDTEILQFLEEFYTSLQDK